VAPVAAYKEFAKVYFPGEGSDNFYYNLWTDEPYLCGSTEIVESPLHQLPVFAKPGAIIPLHNAIQHTIEHPGQELQLHIYHSGDATNFTWYYDAGEGFGFKTGEFAIREIELSGEGLTIAAQEGSFEVPFKWVKVMFHGYKNINALLVNGKEATLQTEKFTWMAGLPNFDPLGPDLPVPFVEVATTQFEFLTTAIQLNWQLEE
jgi:alpha-glucosidase